MKLRPYQQDIIDQARDLIRSGEKRILLQSPTGSGKTALTANMLGTAASRDIASWFVVHRRELVKQSCRTFRSAGIAHGVVAAGFPMGTRNLVQVCSVQTLAGRHTYLRPPRMIVWDEAHHIAAGSWSKIFAAYPDAVHIGLSATPQRLDSTGLSAYFNRMIEGPTVTWLIENKYLAPYRMFAPSTVDMTNVKTRMGDFVKSETEAAMDKPTVTGDAVREYLRRARGKRAVVFCVSIEHSRHVVAQFQASGIRAEHVDGETDQFERDAALMRFEKGETQVLSNVELFGEGFDLPAIEVCIMLRPTQSLGLYLQQVGRALRPSPGKREAILLDHAGNVMRHGLPDDEREWTLEGDRKRGRKKDPDDIPIKTCPSCFRVLRSSVSVCDCGHVFTPKGREIEVVEGDLAEIDVQALRRARMREQGAAQTLEDLRRLAAMKGYKPGWAEKVFAARQAKQSKNISL